MRFLSIFMLVVVAAAFIACTTQVQTTQTLQDKNTAGDAGSSLDAQFDSFDEPSPSMADQISDQDLAAAMTS